MLSTHAIVDSGGTEARGCVPAELFDVPPPVPARWNVRMAITSVAGFWLTLSTLLRSAAGEIINPSTTVSSRVLVLERSDASSQQPSTVGGSFSDCRPLLQLGPTVF